MILHYLASLYLHSVHYSHIPSTHFVYHPQNRYYWLPFLKTYYMTVCVILFANVCTSFQLITTKRCRWPQYNTESALTRLPAIGYHSVLEAPPHWPVPGLPFSPSYASEEGSSEPSQIEDIWLSIFDVQFSIRYDILLQWAPLLRRSNDRGLTTCKLKVAICISPKKMAYCNFYSFVTPFYLFARFS